MELSQDFVRNYIHVKINYIKWGLKLRCTYNYLLFFYFINVQKLFLDTDVRLVDGGASIASLLGQSLHPIEIYISPFQTIYVIARLWRCDKPCDVLTGHLFLVSNALVKFVYKVWSFYWQCFRSKLPRGAESQSFQTLVHKNNLPHTTLFIPQGFSIHLVFQSP